MQQRPQAFSFPDRIGTALRGDITDFEPRAPGLGRSATYHLQGWRITLYAYDLRRTDLPLRADAAVIRLELGQAAEDIRVLERRGDYTRVEHSGSFQLPDGPRPPQFLCHAFLLESPAGVGGVRSGSAQFDSYLCVTTWQRQFIKARLSTERRPASLGEAQRFMTALIARLRG